VKFDAIITGAGPAGSTCGRILASKGFKVLILDKSLFPRYKACGGGLTGKAVRELEPGWEGLIEDNTFKIIFYHRQENPLNICYQYPVVKMISRDKFDNLLLQQAVAAGAVVACGQKATAVEEMDNEVIVRCQSGDIYRGRYLVGADGALSLVRKSLPFATGNLVGITLECEVPVPDTVMERFKGQVHLSYGEIPYGYGWIFPKGRHLSVGIGSFTKQIKGLKGFFNSFCRGIGLNIPGKVRCHGAVIPSAGSNSGIFNTKYSVLVGDAAGLVDPFSGEGIYYALKSGRIAAEVITAAEEGLNGLEAYTMRINNEVLRTLRFARRIAQVVYNMSPVVHRLVTQNPDVARKLVEVLFGQNTYDCLWQYLKERYAIFRLAR